jgi:hypothetical protein
MLCLLRSQLSTFNGKDMTFSLYTLV